MRHGNKINHLGRKTAHRTALLKNMSNSLIEHKRITTTLAKAKVLRQHIEPLLTKAKSDTTHNRRILFSYLQNKESIKELYGNIAEKIADRPGGYTRIIKLGFRYGDAAEMAMIELVDFNETYIKEVKVKTAKTRRGRKGSTAAVSTVVDAIETQEVLEETPAIEEAVAEETVVEETPAVEEAVAEETVVEETPAVEEASEEVAEDATSSEEEKTEE